MGAEKTVSFDNGLNGSIAEDAYFAIKAMDMGFTFNFIEGEMREKSPFSFSDFIANLLCVNCVFFKTKLRLLKKNKFYNIYVTGYDEPIFNFFKTDLRVFLKKNYFLFINTILKQNQFLLYNRDKKKVLNDLIENLSSSVVGKQCACQLYGIFLNTNLDQYSCLSIKKTVKLLYVLVIVIIYKRILKSVN